jgi:hypothetical protein
MRDIFQATYYGIIVPTWCYLNCMFAITKKRGIGERGEKGDKEKLKEAT